MSPYLSGSGAWLGQGFPTALIWAWGSPIPQPQGNGTCRQQQWCDQGRWVLVGTRPVPLRRCPVVQEGAARGAVSRDTVLGSLSGLNLVRAEFQSPGVISQQLAGPHPALLLPWCQFPSDPPLPGCRRAPGGVEGGKPEGSGLPSTVCRVRRFPSECACPDVNA